jgi:hypothetical protein
MQSVGYQRDNQSVREQNEMAAAATQLHECTQNILAPDEV